MTVAPDVAAPLAEALRLAGLDSVEGAFSFGGGSDLHKAGLGHRRRTRVELTDTAGHTHELYLKRYGREPLEDRLKRIFRPARGRSPAETEYRNIAALHQAGVPTMSAVAWGQETALGGVRRSYLVVTAVPGDALERAAEAFLDDARGGRKASELTDRLVELVSALHGAGLVHRDLYASHIFLEESDAGVKLHLIDLARVFRPRWRRFRWRVKDLAQLRYSMPDAWLHDQWERFLQEYLSATGQGPSARWSSAIATKVAGIRRHDEHRARRASP